MLVVRLANDARQAMRRAEGMGRCEAIEARGANTSMREMVQGRAPHRSEAHDNDVGSVSHSAGQCIGPAATSIGPLEELKKRLIRLPAH